MAEITRKSVLLECLSIMREEQRICSKGYNCLEPAKGMEEAWEQGRRKIELLEDIIHALDSEPVLRAMAGWQKEIVERGPSLLNVDDYIKAAVYRESGEPAGGDPSTTANASAQDDTERVTVNVIHNDQPEPDTEFLKHLITVDKEAFFTGSWEKLNMGHEDGTMELR